MIPNPASGASEPTIHDLNPFSGGDISILSYGERFPGASSTGNLNDIYSGLRTSDSGFTPGEARPVCLRGPVWIGGWGYDENGNPTPSGADGEFISNYKSRTDQWKVGPLDVRWNDSRKVWGFPPGGGYYLGKVVGFGSTIIWGSSTYKIVTASSSTSSNVTFDSTTYDVPNIAEPSGLAHMMPSGAMVVVYEYNSQKYINEVSRSLIY